MAHSHDWKLMLAVGWELTWDFSKCLPVASQYGLGLLPNDCWVPRSVPTMRIPRDPVRGYNSKKLNWGLEFANRHLCHIVLVKRVTQILGEGDRFHLLMRRDFITEVMPSLRAFLGNVICLNSQKIIQIFKLFQVMPGNKGKHPLRDTKSYNVAN